MKVDLFSDGSAKGNPNGPGGYGSILHFRDSSGTLHVREYSGGYKLTTNNRMELMGVIVALEALNRPCEVRVVSDSKYLTDAFNAGWMDSWLRNNWKTSGKKPVKNVDLWKRLLVAMKPHKVSFVWVKGHAGHPENERCDRLACTAAEGDVLLDDNVEEMI
ncbi:MAG: ribonuclease HI [Lachnospiraceae bacterium]|nr:ribonuclease HI [Lachnospiraceae bacterium]